MIGETDDLVHGPEATGKINHLADSTRRAYDVPLIENRQAAGVMIGPQRGWHA